MSLVHDVILWAGPVNYAAGKGGDMLMMKSIVQKDTRKTKYLLGKDRQGLSPIGYHFFLVSNQDLK